MKTAFNILINKQRWRVRFSRSVKVLEDGEWHECDGSCDPAKKEIRLLNTLRGKQLTRVLLHEIKHAFVWALDEEVVDQLSIDEAEALDHPEIRGRS